MSDARATELAGRLARVRERIAGACALTGRDPGEVRLVVVTKFFPATDVARLVRLGVGDIGENRDQEAARKAAEIATLLDPAPRLHFVGQLQTNKAASVARYADVVQSVDRLRVVAALAKGAQSAGRDLDVLLQVGLDSSAGRGGADPGALDELAAAVAAAPRLTLRGLMAVAPLGADPDPAFARLAALHAELRRAHPEATWLSAGMSADLEVALAHGATVVRVGTAILGPRPVPG